VLKATAANFNKVLFSVLHENVRLVSQAADEAVKETAEEACEYIALQGNYKDRRLNNSYNYRKSFYVDKKTNGKYSIKNYKHRLSHLLEKGHATRNGTSRTRAFKMFDKTRKHVRIALKPALEKRIMETLNNAR
jgi:hypothetical protein